MAKKGSFSKVYDKNGDYADVEAVRFDGTRTIQMQGDVTASQTWNGDPSAPLTLNASIGAKKVTTDKINDKAVQTGQIDDGAVGLPQIATNAMNGTVQDNDSKLATHAAVKTYVDAQISGQGTYLGKHTVAEINAMVTDNLHNGDRLMTSDSGTVNLGPGGVGFDVEVGEDLILYKSGSTVQWDSMDGNFKTKQTAVSDPTASGTGMTFIDSIFQDENGEISATKKTVQDGTTSQKGVVELEDSTSSTSTTKAATPNSVKSAYDLANTANTGLANKLDKTGDGKDVTATFTEASARVNIGTGEKLSVMFGKIKKWFTDLKALAFKDTVSDSDISGTISDNHIASASTWNGKADKVSGATNGNLAALDSNGNLTDSGKKASDFELEANKVTSWHGTPDNTHYPSEKLVKDGLDAKAAANKVVAICDSNLTVYDVGINKWFKIAERTFAGTQNGFLTWWDVEVNNISIIQTGTLCCSVSYSTSGTELNSYSSFFCDEWMRASFKFVTRGLSGHSITIELWASLNNTYTGLSIRERSNGNIQPSISKGYWKYYSYLNTDGSAAPTEDAETHTKVNDVEIIIRQHAIASPTNDNLVAMDANGLVKDGGLTKSSVESAISSAGSAIQGVKVNNTTLTPDANKVVTIPNATTSADGAMSADDKTKLDGIAAGAEANVQADWNSTNSSSDAFIKNKPYYTKYNTTSTYYKVCSFPVTDAQSVDISGLQILARYYSGGVNGRLIYKNGFRLYYERVSDVYANTQFVKFHYVKNGSKIDLYAERKGYPTLHVAPLVNQPKSRVDFTDFGTEVPSLPEGATEITPVWVANSERSSGTAPVKVNAFGDLTPVPMDSIPTASSTNLMTSGGIKTALDNAVANVNMRYPFGVRQNRTTSYGYRLFNVKFDTAQSATKVRISGNIVVGTTGNNEHISFDLVIANVNTVENNPSSINLLTTSTRRGSRVVRLAYKRPSNWNDGLDVFILWNAEGTATAANDTYGWEITQQEATKPSGVEVKDENLTSALTGFTLDSPRTFAITEGTSAIGSTSVPVYVNENGVIIPCTDTFVNDIAYVANQSGGGGNLNKTINGTTTSVLTFMNDSEAVAIWADAKTAAANES